MQRPPLLVAIALGLAGVITACRPAAVTPAPKTPPALRVGVTPDSPPYVMLRGDALTGLEVDFARELERALGRPIRFVELPWEDQISGLLQGQTDVIMCGMSATRAREASMAFSKPYLRSGLLALVRRADVGLYPSTDALLRSTARFGVVAGTTGEGWARERPKLMTVARYGTTTAAVLELTQRRIDTLIHDAPIVIWVASQNEAEMAPLLKRLNDEPLAWGVRRGDDALRADLDEALARWETDGTRARILDRWIPYWRKLEGG